MKSFLLPAATILKKYSYQATSAGKCTGVPHEFHKVSSVLYIGSFTRPVKIGAIQCSRKAPSKSKSKLWRPYIAADSIMNLGRLSRSKIGLRHAAASQSNQFSWKTYNMNFIKRERKLSLKYAGLRETVIQNLGHIIFNLVRVSFTAISNAGNERAASHNY